MEENEYPIAIWVELFVKKEVKNAIAIPIPIVENKISSTEKTN